MTAKILSMEQGHKEADELLYVFKGIEKEGEERGCQSANECPRGLCVSSVVPSPR